MIAEAMVLLLAAALMVGVLRGPQRNTHEGAVLLALAVSSAAAAVLHQWMH
jgi:hypothetical protein